MTNNIAWPGVLRSEARAWEQDVARRLRTLPSNLWLLWTRLLQGDSNLDLAMNLGWSKRTIERGLTKLYLSIDVQCRTAAVNMAWQWGLVNSDRGTVNWVPSAVRLFPIPMREEPTIYQEQIIELGRNYR